MKFLCLAALLIVCFIQIEANPLGQHGQHKRFVKDMVKGVKNTWDKIEDKFDDLEDRVEDWWKGDDDDDDRRKRDTDDKDLNDFLNWMTSDDELPKMTLNWDDDRRKRDTDDKDLNDFLNWMSSDDELPKMTLNWDDDRQKRSAGDELKELVISSQQKNMLNTMMANAQTAFSQAQQGATKFFNAALNSQIGLARETFLKGLEQLQTAADGYMDQGVDALKKYLPGLQGVVASRVDSVSKALDKYVADNKGKMDEVRQILLENAQQTLANLKGKLASAKSTAAVTSIVNAVDAVENQVVNV